MTIYTVATDIAAQLRWDFVTNTQTFSSPLAASEQQAELPGARFVATLTYTNLKAATQRPLMSLLAKLRGAAGRCYLPIAPAFPRQGLGGGTPLVNGFGQTGRTLVIDGATPNVTGWLKDGDYFHVDAGGLRELHILTVDVDTNGSGQATLTFEPPLRNSPADNAAVEIDNPSALMRLVDDNQVGFTFKPGRHSDGAAKFIEAFPT